MNTKCTNEGLWISGHGLDLYLCFLSFVLGLNSHFLAVLFLFWD